MSMLGDSSRCGAYRTSPRVVVEVVRKKSSAVPYTAKKICLSTTNNLRDGRAHVSRTADARGFNGKTMTRSSP